MSGFKKNNGRDFSAYDAMSVEELEKILQRDVLSAETETLDSDTILYIAGLLAKREAAAGVSHPSAEEVWARFERDYAPMLEMLRPLPGEEKGGEEREAKPRGRKRFRVALVASLLLAALFVGLVTAYAFGYNAVGHVAEWTRGVFQIHRADYGETGRVKPMAEEDLARLQQELEGNGIYIAVPHGMLEGFRYGYTNVAKNSLSTSVQNVFVNDSGTEITFTAAALYGNGASHYEKSGEAVEVYSKNGRTFYIMYNIDDVVVVWLEDDVECALYGLITKEEAKDIIGTVE